MYCFVWLQETTPRPNTHTDYNGSSCRLGTGRAQLAQNGTFPGNQGLRDQESQVKILKLSLVAKLYYVTLELSTIFFECGKSFCREMGDPKSWISQNRRWQELYHVSLSTSSYSQIPVVPLPSLCLSHAEICIRIFLGSPLYWSYLFWLHKYLSFHWLIPSNGWLCNGENRPERCVKMVR